MKIRKMKKKIKKLNCNIFKTQALASLRLLQNWSTIKHCNSKTNIKICQGNFLRNGNFINNGIW